MKQTELAYAAGVIDSDGCITIIKNARLGRYTPKIFVRQVETGAVELLHKLFGGSIRTHAPSMPQGRPLNQWEISNLQAYRAASVLVKFLRIKHPQAKILIKFGQQIAQPKLRRRSFWFKSVRGEKTYTPQEAAEIKNIDRNSVYQAISNGSIPSIKRKGRRFIPCRFWDSYTMVRGQHPLPPEYVAMKENLRNNIRKLNGPTKGVPTLSR